jgi:AraC family transcriptional regulator of arabinose operon
MDTEKSYSPPPDILVTGHFHEQHGYAVYREHGSGNWLITYTLQGRGLYRQTGIQIWAEPGDIVLLQPGVLHDYSIPVDTSWEFLWSHFQPRLSWLAWWHLPEVGQGCYKVHIRALSERERVRQAFLKLAVDASLPQIDAAPEPLRMLQRELALNGLEEVLLIAVRETAQGTEHVLDARVEHILHLISQDLTMHYDLEILAQKVSLSPSRLSHLFKQEVGDSITNVILTMRLQKAARLLEFSSHSIKMIAEEVGFTSAFYFSRQFHQCFGRSPREYRESIVSQLQETPGVRD